MRLIEIIGKNPTKLIELASIRKDLDNLKETVVKDNESLRRELDRISSYNTTIIMFMITFMVAIFGLGLLNIFQQRKKS